MFDVKNYIKVCECLKKERISLFASLFRKQLFYVPEEDLRSVCEKVYADTNILNKQLIIDQEGENNQHLKFLEKKVKDLKNQQYQLKTYLQKNVPEKLSFNEEAYDQIQQQKKLINEDTIKESDNFERKDVDSLFKASENNKLLQKLNSGIMAGNN